VIFPSTFQFSIIFGMGFEVLTGVNMILYVIFKGYVTILVNN